MTWRRLIIATGCVCVLAALAIGISIFRYVAAQQRNMKLAERHVPIVLSALNADPRFAEIVPEPITANGGCLLVAAVVEPGTSDELKRIVAATKPPVFVWYDIHETRSATRPSK